MTALLGFILECAAIAALLGTAASVLAWLAMIVCRPMASRVNPSARADFVFLAGVMPAIVAIAGTAAAAAPSLAAAVGLVADHCGGHGHHMHVCIVHRTGLRPDLALLGGIALAAWLVRTCSLLRNALEVANDVRTLERLGTATSDVFAVIEVPGSAPLCHATGFVHRRILLSTGLAARLEPAELRCALAHERAHLQRRDPLASVFLSLAGLFVPPPLASLFQRAYRTSAEEACDDEAARVVGNGPLVAGALVAVARAQQAGAWRPSAAQVFGFGQHRLETRVRRLLARTAIDPQRAYALPIAAAAGLIVFVAALQHAAFFHHAVETALDRLF